MLPSQSSKDETSNAGEEDEGNENEEAVSLGAAKKKSAHMLAKNLDMLAKVERNESKEVEELETPTTEVINEAVTVDSQGNIILKGDDMIKMKRRGSYPNERKALVFPFALSSMTLSDTSKTPDERTNSTSTIETAWTACSLNVGVHNLEMDVPSTNMLTPVEAMVLSCVLQESLEQLCTMRYAIPAEVDHRWHEVVMDLDQIYDVPDERKIIFREDMNLLPVVQTPAAKMQQDRHYIYEILHTTAQELKSFKRFHRLVEEIDALAKLQEAERNLEADCALWENQVKQLRDLIQAERETNQKEKEALLKVSHEITADIDSAIFVNGSEIGYNGRWESARLGQQNIKLAQKEEELRDKLQWHKKVKSVDQIISGEVCVYLEEDMRQIEEQISAWTTRYNTEIVQRQQVIDDLKERVEEQKLALTEMRQVAEEYRVIIDEHEAEEKRIKEAIEHERLLNNAATLIQAIWRGYMVRHELGEFKGIFKKPKKGGKKKKKKKMKK